MRFIQASIIPLILLVTMLSTGCTLPVCCAPEPEAPLFPPEVDHQIN